MVETSIPFLVTLSSFVSYCGTRKANEKFMEFLFANIELCVGVGKISIAIKHQQNVFGIFNVNYLKTLGA